MNQTYSEWYEFDVNVVLILIVLILINQHCTEYECIRVVEFQYC